MVQPKIDTSGYSLSHVLECNLIVLPAKLFIKSFTTIDKQ